MGVTATPDRGDKRNLGKFYQHVAAEVSLLDLIHDGYLAPIKIKSVPLKIDLSKVASARGDLAEKELGDALEPYLPKIAEAIGEHAAWRKMLVFLPLRATSRLFVDACRAAGLSAMHVDGASLDRKEILQAYAAGEFDILANAMLLTEGFDDPSIDGVTILRATRSRALYSQMVGRGTRISKGKADLLLLDFLWQHEKHSLIRPAHLIAGGDDALAAGMTKLAEAKGGQGIQEELDLEGLKSEFQAKREAALARELEAKAKKQGRLVDAMEFCLSLGNEELGTYTPEEGWEWAPPTRAQKAELTRLGFDLEAIKTTGFAARVLDVVQIRRQMDLATPKQLRLLKKLRAPGAETMTFKAASEWLDWRLPERKKAA